jgi:hypothetical protein
LLPPALLPRRLGTALLLRWGSRWLLRASACPRRRSGWPLRASARVREASATPASAREASATPAGVSAAPAEEKVFLAVLGIHLELPPVVQLDRGGRQAVQHRRPHVLQGSASSFWLDWPLALLRLRYPHCQPARSRAARARTGRADVVVLLIPPGRFAAVLARSFPASQHIGLVGSAGGLPIQRHREVHDPRSPGRLGCLHSPGWPCLAPRVPPRRRSVGLRQVALVRHDDARHLPLGPIDLGVDALLSQLGVLPHLCRQLG